MRSRTKRIRLRIDLALTPADGPPSSRRRQPLVPPAGPTPDRLRPTLLAPDRDGSARLAAQGARGD